MGDSAFEEADLRDGVRDGGQVLGAFVVQREDYVFVVYMRVSWTRGRGFRILRSWRGRTGDRGFKGIDVALRFIRRYGFAGRVTLYPRGDAELAGFAGVAEEDLPRTGASSA